MNKKFGFTLIELLAVILILGILRAIALPQYRRSIQRAEAANALINLRTIFDSAKRFKAANSHWPTSFTGLDVDLFDISSDGNMGDFQYTFGGTGTISACRLVNGSASNTFCLKAYYRKNTQRDVFTCQDQSGTGHKYQHLCSSLCPTPGSDGSECEIK